MRRDGLEAWEKVSFLLNEVFPQRVSLYYLLMDTTEKHFTWIAHASHITIMKEVSLRMVPTLWMSEGKKGSDGSLMT